MPIMAQMAAELIGSVSKMPTATETTMPIKNGCSSVAVLMNAPR